MPTSFPMALPHFPSNGTMLSQSGMDTYVTTPINDLYAIAGAPALTYTPALTAATTNPTLGSGGTITGRYRQVGQQVFGEIHVGFGTSGAAAGSGAYSLTVPVVGVVGVILGHGFVQCAGLWTPVKMQWATSTTVTLRYLTAAVNGGKSAVSNSLPGVFTNNDTIDLTFAYEAA